MPFSHGNLARAKRGAEARRLRVDDGKVIGLSVEITSRLCNSYVLWEPSGATENRAAIQHAACMQDTQQHETNDSISVREEIENLKVAQATQAAAFAGAQATQAAVTAGAAATQSAMTAGAAATQAAATAGVWSTMAAGFVALVVGLFLGGTLARR